eukprot:8031440-Alexandrium_andersonii.AAC.1
MVERAGDSAGHMTEDEELATTCVWAWAEFNGVLNRAGRFLTAFEASEQYRLGILGLACYAELNRRLHTQPGADRNWACKPKMHMLHHMIIDTKRNLVNPRFGQCFVDEDLVGKRSS